MENQDIQNSLYIREEMSLHITSTQDTCKLQPQFQLSGRPDTSTISILAMILEN